MDSAGAIWIGEKLSRNEEHKKPNIRKIAVGGVFCAAIALATAYIKIPSPVGYIHAGDGIIFASVGAMGLFAAVPAALGSMFADLLANYPLYAPVTFLVKGAMALAAAVLLKRLPEKLGFLAFIPPALMMITGYFVYECFLYSPAAALVNIPFNLIQAAAGVLVGAVLSPASRRLSK